MTVAVSALLAALTLSGCGSAGAGTRSVAGIQAAGKNVASNLEAGSFRRACEGFTAGAQRRLAAFPEGGCPGALALSRGLLAIEGNESVGQVFNRQLAQILPRLRIHGDAASYNGVVEARYERGRWRFEGASSEMPLARAQLKVQLERALATLGAGG